MADHLELLQRVKRENRRLKILVVVVFVVLTVSGVRAQLPPRSGQKRRSFSS